MKKLALEVIRTKWGKMLRVKEQTHKGNEFGKEDNNTYTASNGFLLSSYRYLLATEKDNGLCVRGDEEELDNAIATVPSEEWLKKLRVAVREYNETFSDKPAEEDIEIIK